MIFEKCPKSCTPNVLVKKAVINQSFLKIEENQKVNHGGDSRNKLFSLRAIFVLLTKILLLSNRSQIFLRSRLFRSLKSCARTRAQRTYCIKESRCPTHTSTSASEVEVSNYCI